MDETQQQELRAIGEELVDLGDAIDAAFEEHASFQLKLQTRIKVEEMVTRYRALLASVSDADRTVIERHVGRKVSDLQKLAGPLPTPPAGKPAEIRPQKEFFEARPISASSSRQPRLVGVAAGGLRRGEAPRIKVGGDIEAWCNRCEGMHTHTVLAVSGNEPLQVTCHACKGTHKFRQAAPEKKSKPDGTVRRPTALTAAEREANQRAQDRNAFLAELSSAAATRPYDPRERYKPGEILEHTHFGRGKIENILPRSMLVRFAGGLKTLKLG